VTGREAVTAANKPAVPTLQQKHPLAVYARPAGSFFPDLYTERT